MMGSRPLRILTWHVHGSYLEYLSNVRHEIYLPVQPGRPPGYAGLAPGRAWRENLHEVPFEQVRDLDLDVVIYQSHPNWLEDRWGVLSASQRLLPSIVIEHDPPRRSPTETRHPVDDAKVLLVHVTHFNRLMWDSGRTPTIVIEHGVTVPPGIAWTGELPRGVAVVNGIGRRERRVGPDVLEQVRRVAPIDLYGMFSEELGGLGELRMPELARTEARYRFFFNPIRWTSLGLAVCEAMAIGLPIVGLATTGMVGVVENGISGFLDTDLGVLVNTDAGVRRLKGPDRPVDRLEDRAEVLAALSCVDLVVPFDEDTPAELIRLVRPDIFVKGGDHAQQMLPEAAIVQELGGRIQILPYVEDRSTSSIIARIQRSSGEAVVRA